MTTCPAKLAIADLRVGLDAKSSAGSFVLPGRGETHRRLRPLQMPRHPFSLYQ